MNVASRPVTPGKTRTCPHCKAVGMLNRHSFSYGRDDASPRKETVRARRIFCSNRNARRGCGHTFSVWCADKIRRLSLTTACLWRFLQLAAAGTIQAAFRAANSPRSDRTMQRLWKRFGLGQSKIRTALLEARKMNFSQVARRMSGLASTSIPPSRNAATTASTRADGLPSSSPTSTRWSAPECTTSPGSASRARM